MLASLNIFSWNVNCLFDRRDNSPAVDDVINHIRPFTNQYDAYIIALQEFPSDSWCDRVDEYRHAFQCAFKNYKFLQHPKEQSLVFLIPTSFGHTQMRVFKAEGAYRHGVLLIVEDIMVVNIHIAKDKTKAIRQELLTSSMDALSELIGSEPACSSSDIEAASTRMTIVSEVVQKKSDLIHQLQKTNEILVLLTSSIIEKQRSGPCHTILVTGDFNFHLEGAKFADIICKANFKSVFASSLDFICDDTIYTSQHNVEIRRATLGYRGPSDHWPLICQVTVGTTYRGGGPTYANIVSYWKEQAARWTCETPDSSHSSVSDYQLAESYERAYEHGLRAYLEQIGVEYIPCQPVLRCCVCKDHKASLSFTVNQRKKARLSSYEPMCADCSIVMDEVECKSEIDQKHYMYCRGCGKHRGAGYFSYGSDQCFVCKYRSKPQCEWPHWYEHMRMK